jgi:TP901 family phage tail tape measure protein
MTSDMRLHLFLGLRGSEAFVSGLRKITQSTNQSTRQMVRSWGNVNNRLSGVHGTLLRIAAFVGGGALLRQAVLDVAEFERGLMETRLTGSMTAKEIEKVRSTIIALSSETLQLPEDQLAAFQKMVAAGVDPKKALAGMKAIDKAATASFANVVDMAAASVDLFDKMEIEPEKLQRALNIMYAAGNEGKFELKDMAQYFPEITSDAQRFGMVGEKGVAQVSAMLQVAMKGTALPSEAANNMRNFFAQITQYREAFSKIGVNVWEFVNPKTGRFRAEKDVDAFFKEIIKKSKGSTAVLEMAGIRDRQAKDFIIQMMANWKEYERIRDKSLGSADNNGVDTAFDEVNKTKYANLKRLEIERSKAMKSGGSSWVAEKATKLGNWAVENPGKAGTLLLGGYSIFKWLKSHLSKLPREIKDISTKPGTPPPGLPNEGPIQGPKTGDWYKPKLNKPTPDGRLLRFLTVASPAIPVVGSALWAALSMQIGQKVATKQAESMSIERLMDLRARHMVMGGGANSPQVKTIDAEIARKFAEQIKNEISIQINIDGQGRTVSKVDNMNTKVNTIKRGSFDQFVLPQN